ncbi:MAG TPA: hypothetical protein VK638_54230, partial [Edaphobacter sp.]|nr:hypothetical protein [Edaphobacter sp.]
LLLCSHSRRASFNAPVKQPSAWTHAPYRMACQMPTLSESIRDQQYDPRLSLEPPISMAAC